MSKKRQPPQGPDPTSLLKRIAEVCDRSITSLDGCIKRIAKELSDSAGADYDKDLASHQAWLTKNVAQIGGEIRKMEHFEQKSNAEITPRVLHEYIRKLTPDQRQQLIRDIQAMDRGGSVLG